MPSSGVLPLQPVRCGRRDPEALPVASVVSDPRQALLYGRAEAGLHTMLGICRLAGFGQAASRDG